MAYSNALARQKDLPYLNGSLIKCGKRSGGYE
jgi:hypothetical protein